MKAIDTDPAFLRQLGETTAHAYDQAITHIEAEKKGVIPELMETLTENGPYGYTITPQVLPDGGVNLPVISTREGIEGAYKMIRGASDLLAVNPLTEIRGTWYTFQDDISSGSARALTSGGPMKRWASSPPPPARASPESWCGYECLDRSSAEVIHRPTSRPRRCTCGSRSSSSTIASCRHCCSLIWTAYSARSTTVPLGSTRLCRGHGNIDLAGGRGGPCRLLPRLLRQVRGGLGGALIVRRRLVRLCRSPRRRECEERIGGRPVRAFHTAEFHIPANDGRFIARIGHGTDLAAVNLPAELSDLVGKWLRAGPHLEALVWLDVGTELAGDQDVGLLVETDEQLSVRDQLGEAAE